MFSGNHKERPDSLRGAGSWNLVGSGQWAFYGLAHHLRAGQAGAWRSQGDAMATQWLSRGGKSLQSLLCVCGAV